MRKVSPACPLLGNPRFHIDSRTRDCPIRGQNTSCVELQTEYGNLLVLDCGAGIRELGRSLLGRSATPPKIHILIGHTHWDHRQGFSFFTPVLLPGTAINIYAPLGFQRNLEDALSGQMKLFLLPRKAG
jgi:phosphoribosyl 1,2-cyclic phosphodiesterase